MKLIEKRECRQDALNIFAAPAAVLAAAPAASYLVLYDVLFAILRYFHIKHHDKFHIDYYVITDFVYSDIYRQFM